MKINYIIKIYLSIVICFFIFFFMIFLSDKKTHEKISFNEESLNKELLLAKTLIESYYIENNIYPISSNKSNHWKIPWVKFELMEKIIPSWRNNEYFEKILKSNFYILYKSDGANFKFIIFEDKNCKEIVVKNQKLNTTRDNICSYGIYSTNAENWKPPKRYRSISRNL